jgi:hypothetical protein
MLVVVPGVRARSPRPAGRSDARPPPSPEPARPDVLRSLQRTAGNRATARLLQRFPEAKDIDSFWSDLVREVEAENRKVKDLDCRAASDRVAVIGNSRAKRRKITPTRTALTGPLYRISNDDLDATPTEAKEAHGRGWKVRDRVVSSFGRDYMKVHRGGADGATPTIEFYPLLPGMMIYSAEDVGWKDKKQGTYRWYLRHAAVYRSEGWIRENFGAQRRNIKQGHPQEDRSLGAYGSDDNPSFLTTLAIYDPFYAYRSKEEADWLSRAPMHAPAAIWEAAKQWWVSAATP